MSDLGPKSGKFHLSLDARESLVRRTSLVILAVTIAIDLLLRQVNLETTMLATILTVIEFLAIGVLVLVFVRHRRREKHQSKHVSKLPV